MPAHDAATPRRRADAARNIEALLDAAKAVFARSGVDAPAKEITDLAGVGVGTLYRHFPRRSDLIIAVLQHELDDGIAEAHRLAETAEPWPAVLAWMERFVDLVGTKSGLAAALHSGDAAYENLPERLMGQLEPALRMLLDRAIEAGRVRDDVEAREILTAVALICQTVPGVPASFNRRMTRVYLDGLRR